MKLSVLVLIFQLAVISVRWGNKISNLFDQMSDARQLDSSTWKSSIDCQTWIGISSWAFLNEKWTTDTKDNISKLPYNQTSDYAYCKSAVKYGIIDLSKIDGNDIDLTFSKDAWSTGHLLWEWNINTSNDIPLNISVIRLAYNYEDILITLHKKSGTSIITSK